MPLRPPMLQNCFFKFAVEHLFCCRATEPGFARDNGAVDIWLIDWLIWNKGPQLLIITFLMWNYVLLPLCSGTKCWRCIANVNNLTTLSPQSHHNLTTLVARLQITRSRLEISLLATMSLSASGSSPHHTIWQWRQQSSRNAVCPSQRRSMSCKEVSGPTPYSFSKEALAQQAVLDSVYCRVGQCTVHTSPVRHCFYVTFIGKWGIRIVVEQNPLNAWVLTRDSLSHNNFEMTNGTSLTTRGVPRGPRRLRLEWKDYLPLHWRLLPGPGWRQTDTIRMYLLILARLSLHYGRGIAAEN